MGLDFFCEQRISVYNWQNWQNCSGAGALKTKRDSLILIPFKNTLSFIIDFM